jgi:hypothetical protein
MMVLYVLAMIVYIAVVGFAAALRVAQAGPRSGRMSHGDARSAAVPAGCDRRAPAVPRLSIDVKDANVLDSVRLLADVGGFQAVADPGVSCTLTLALKDVDWPTVLDVALRSCGLAEERDGQRRARGPGVAAASRRPRSAASSTRRSG